MSHSFSLNLLVLVDLMVGKRLMARKERNSMKTALRGVWQGNVDET